MCRSTAERPPDGRRCPRQHSVGGYSDSRENRSARQQLSRARRGLLQARAAEDSGAIDTWKQKVAAAQQRVDASKDESASPIVDGEPPTATERRSAGLETRKASAAAVRHGRTPAADPSEGQSDVYRSGASEFHGDPKMAAEFRAQVLQGHELVLSPDEVATVNDYVLNSSPVNNHLRDATLPAHRDREAQSARHAAVLSQVISRSTVKRPMVVYRGFNLDDKPQFRVGDVVSDPAFASTSYDPSVAREFADTNLPNPVLTVISVPVGASALPLDPVKYDLEYNQSEVVLNAAQALRVTSVEDNGRTVHLVVEP